MKIAYRLLSVLIITLLVSAQSYALDVEIMPSEVLPGDLFLVSIQTSEPDSAEAEFLGRGIKFYPDGEGRLIALVPVDINTKPGKHNIKIKLADKAESLAINVKSHEFETIKLTLPKGKVTLNPENQKRALQEAALLKEIWQQGSPKAWNGRFQRPLDTEISTVFGVKRIMNEKKTSVHRGTDFRGKTGTPVRALNSGTVVLSDDLFFGGNTLVIDHGMGLYSVYMHLSKFNVSEGEKVTAEQVVGLVGSSGRVTGPHLHLSVKLNGVSLNPESLFKLEFRDTESR